MCCESQRSRSCPGTPPPPSNRTGSRPPQLASVAQPRSRHNQRRRDRNGRAIAGCSLRTVATVESRVRLTNPKHRNRTSKGAGSRRGGVCCRQTEARGLGVRWARVLGRGAALTQRQSRSLGVRGKLPRQTTAKREWTTRLHSERGALSQGRTEPLAGHPLLCQTPVAFDGHLVPKFFERASHRLPNASTRPTRGPFTRCTAPFPEVSVFLCRRK